MRQLESKVRELGQRGMNKDSCCQDLERGQQVGEREVGLRIGGTPFKYKNPKSQGPQHILA